MAPYNQSTSLFNEAAAHKQRGASMLEYSLMAALLAVVVISAVGYAGERVAETFDKAAALANEEDPPPPPG